MASLPAAKSLSTSMVCAQPVLALFPIHPLLALYLVSMSSKATGPGDLSLGPSRSQAQFLW
jgi:hypothetical protein